MSSSFLLSFTRTVVARLCEAGQLIVAEGAEEQVAEAVAEHLSGAGVGAQAVSALVSALVACPQVEELFAEDEDIMRLMESMGPLS